MIARRAMLAGLGTGLGIGAGLCAGLLAAPVWALPDPPVPGIRRLYLDGPFGQIHVRVAEAAGPRRSVPPLVLLHQSPLSGRMFERIMPLLAAGRTVIAVDTPGYGESDRPAERPPLAGYSDAILAALAPRFGARFDFLGYHTGTVIAADLAARTRAIRRLVLVSAPLFPEARRQALLTQLRSPEVPYADDGSHLLPLWTGSARSRPEGQSMDDMARLVAEKLRPGRFREWALLSAIEADFSRILAAVRQPTLVLAPHDGLEVASAAAAHALAHGRLVDLPALKYGLFDANPAHLATLILEFLESPRY